MGRTASYSGSTKPIAGGVAETLTWPSSDIDSTGVVGFYIGFQPVGNTIAAIDRVRVRAAGQVIFEATLAQILALQAGLSWANYSDLTTGARLYVPMNLLDSPTMETQDQCQFPPGAEAQVEVVMLATAVAGTAILGWQLTNQPAKFFQRYVTSASNIPASQNNAKFIFSESGIVRGLTFDVRGVNRAELTISGQRAWNLPGQQFQGLAYGSILAEKDAAESGDVLATFQRLNKCDLILPGASGSTNLVMDTGAAWPGVASEIAVYSVSPIGQFRS